MLPRIPMTFAAVAVALSAPTASSFGVVPPAALAAARPRLATSPNGTSTTSNSTTAPSAIHCEDKSYQLKEREDKDVWMTKLYLNSDRTVSFGPTDGAPYDEAVGMWNVLEGTNDFRMVVRRTYGTGSEGTHMGEFSYDIQRMYVGEMTKVGESVGITGVTHTFDPYDEVDTEVGFFNMIDGTDEKASYEDKAKKLSSS